MRVIYLPSTGRQLYSASSGDIVEYEQLSRLGEIEASTDAIIVTHLRPFVSLLPSPEALSSTALTIRVKDRFDPQALGERLTNRIEAQRAAQDAVNLQQATLNAAQTSTIGCMKQQIDQLFGLTRLVVPNGSVCPGWGNVTITPAAAATTPAG